MSSAGRAENSYGCVTRPKGREIGLSGFAAQIQLYSLTGSYVMATAEHREPYESRGSRTVLREAWGCDSPLPTRLSSHFVHIFQVIQLSIPPLSATSLLSIVAICCPLKSCSNCRTAISSSFMPKVGMITVLCICKKLM